MRKRFKYFTLGWILFWALIGFFVILFFLNLGKLVFESEELTEELIRTELVPVVDTSSTGEQDTAKKISKDSLLISWKWEDFDSKMHRIDFSIYKQDLKKAAENRISSGWPTIYSDLYTHDKIYLKTFIDKMKKDIKQSNLSYLDAIEYVCSSIQYIPYTLILPSNGDCPCTMPFGSFSADCKVQANGRGCCNNADPFGVFSPLEFAYQKTADCDTRALMAYTILNEMGFDVAVMLSESQGHSVLGVALPNANNYSFGRNMLGKKYVLWELTAWGWRLGMGVPGNDWMTALE
jgi:hypothetical protein